MIPITPSFVLKDKDIVQFQCDHCVCTVYKAHGGATIEMKDNTDDDVYVSWYPLDMEMFRVESENDIYYHDDKYIGWQRGVEQCKKKIDYLKSIGFEELSSEWLADLKQFDFRCYEVTIHILGELKHQGLKPKMIHYDEGSTYTLSEEYLQQNHLEKIKKDTNVLIKKRNS